MTAVVLFFVGLGGVLAVGTPIVGLLPNAGTLRGWLRRAPAAARPDRPAVPMHPFVPLDLGPDPMKWPSERPWPKSRVALPDWPSKAWNDEHFGAYWRNRAAGAAAPAPAGGSAPDAGGASVEDAFFAGPASELEALVASAGLAGAVKIIMDRTGWDFRTAAQYLSRNR